MAFIIALYAQVVWLLIKMSQYLSFDNILAPSKILYKYNEIPDDMFVPH
jgi:hypothetical protein